MRTTAAVLSLIGLAGLAQAQLTPPSASQTAVEDAAARQREAVLAMQESLAKQRASVQKQPLQGPSSGFFVLSSPVTIGTNFQVPPVVDCPPLPSAEVDTLVGNAAKRENIEVELIRSVMRQESGFKPCAVSPKGAMGLMQLMPATAQQFGVKDAFDPVENVSAGAKLLKELLTRYKGDRSLALGAYNAGPGAVDAADGVPHYQETIDYINRIISLIGR
jgi:hypothetical protein